MFLLTVRGKAPVSPNRKSGDGISQWAFSCSTWKGLSVINVETYLMSLPTELWLPMLMLPREGRACVLEISGLNLECTFLEKKNIIIVNVFPRSTVRSQFKTNLKIVRNINLRQYNSATSTSSDSMEKYILSSKQLTCKQRFGT